MTDITQVLEREIDMDPVHSGVLQAALEEIRRLRVLALRLAAWAERGGLQTPAPSEGPRD